MSDLWDGLRSRWESIRHAVDAGTPGNGGVRQGVAITEATGPGLATNPITITGIPGAGKTVFYEALAQTLRSGAPDSTRSQKIEKHMIQLAANRWRNRAAVTVIPGQDSTEREKALDDTMRNGASPHGLVYFTCWGHNRIWYRSDQREVLERLGEGGRVVDEDAVRGWHLNKELLDFRTLVDDIIEGRVAERLRWLIVAVSKVDIYWDRLAEARDYYLPGEQGRHSQFGELLRDLAVETSLRLAVLPMGSRVIRHQFLPGLPARTSQLDDAQLGVLRAHFSNGLHEFVHSGEQGRT
ncbi:hypothetical protein O7626_15615 [Micromonospora sp. WMMD1102]|uniref:hypothetical protein n=1 Tax=Micromonospora sp. WMMD1102 TaxID=3016105 RepID=UPI002415779F|nr:hypothetical protein [Micromonospora sp. WMMD1102]MDG4787342.1 hypothetical protein [Micromonospora sp. WMMD1102]